MREHPDDLTLDAYVEDLLDATTRAEVDAHVRACAHCATEVERQRALLVSLRALPARVTPGGDLRLAIRAAIRQQDGLATRGRALRALRLPLAAAAVLLVAVTAGVTTLLLTDRGSVPIAFEPRERPPISLARFDETRADYVRTADELAALLEQHRDSLEPETVALIERNLRTIDEALREADAALHADSSSPVLRELILANEQKRVEVLRWANGLVRG